MRTMDGVLLLCQKAGKGIRRAARSKSVWAGLLAFISGCLLISSLLTYKTTPRRAPLELRHEKAFADVTLSGDSQAIQNRTQELLNPVPFVKLTNHWDGPDIARKHLDNLKWNYLLEEKNVPYVGHPRWLKTLGESHPLYPNALAVFANAREGHEHGDLGVTKSGHQLWRNDHVKPPPFDSLSEMDQKKVLRTRGFYEELSNALPLDRDVIDTREALCKKETFDVSSLPDASIVITFVNEPLSTLLRTLHSVLNNTPAPLIREIILVDDHSNFVDNIPGGPLYEYVKYLPKVKLMRLPERRGIVQARLAGARSAKGDVIVVLDSHIEVNQVWLEPQLQRIRESPKSLVFPQILGISATDFERKTTSGIGCNVNWRWSVVEQSSLTTKVASAAPQPSSSMAGGLFAVDREFFWEIGGYDEGFVAWGAENVELAFRTWMCGGKVECMPCSRTYHIYRKGSTGYQNPVGALWTNRMRTARIWMDEYYQVASRLIDVSANRPAGYGSAVTSEEVPEAAYGNLNTMLKLKDRLQCKSFKWFLNTVDKNHDLQDLDNDVIGLGRVGLDNKCIDLTGHRNAGDTVSLFGCQNGKPSGNQGFLVTRGDNRIRLMSNDKRCLIMSKDLTGLMIGHCVEEQAKEWDINLTSTNSTTNNVKFKWRPKGLCLTIKDTKYALADCQGTQTTWFVDKFTPDPGFELPKLSNQRLRGAGA